MITALLSLTLAAAPYKLAVPALSFVNLDAKTGGLYIDYFAQQLSSHPGVAVVTESEMSSLLGLERQKQLLGCAAGSCTAELAGALGADAVVTGSLAKAGGGYVINLKVIRAVDGTSIAVFSTRVPTENALFDYLKASADQLALQLAPPTVTAAAASATPIETEGTAARAPVLSWATAAVIAVGTVGAGAIYFGVASSQANTLAKGDSSLATFPAASAARYAGETNQAIGLSLFAVGGAAAVTALALNLLPRESLLRKLTPGLLGVAAIVGGGVLLGMAHGDAGEIASADPRIHDLLELDAVRAHGEANQAAGLVLIGAGIAGVAGSLLMWLLEDHSTPVAIGPMRGGGTLTVRF